MENRFGERAVRLRRWIGGVLGAGPPTMPLGGGRGLAARAAGAMMLVGAALIAITVALPPAAHGSDLLILGYGAVLGLTGAVVLRRRRASEPTLGAVAALGTAIITLATLEAGLGRGADDNEVLYLWVSLYAFWFFGLRHALLQLGLIGAGVAILLLDEGPTLAAGMSRWLVVLATFLVSGLLAAWLRRSLEREREETAGLAVVAERIRIARELHDAAGHGVTAISMQAAAGLRSIDTDTEATREALEEIKRTSRIALEDMRRLLGILRPDQAEPDRPVRVGLAQLDRLVDESQRAGVPVRLEVSGQPVQLPSGPDQAAYRIIQEGLTNVLRHAGERAVATLALDYGPATLDLEVSDDGRGTPGPEAPGGQRGLLGMRERTELFGGVFEAGPLPAGGFRVHARLPLGEPATGRPAR